MGTIMNEYVKHLNRIEFAVTMACTGRCKHCSEGEHTGQFEHIDADIAAESIRAVCAHYNIQSLMTFGGEPLLYPDAVCAIQRTAAELGIEKRQVITNGYFSKDPAKITDVVQRLKSCGVNDLLLSADAFHQETIPLEPVKAFAEYAVKAGIPIKLSPAWLVSPEDDNPYNLKTREILRTFSDDRIPVGAGNVVFPSGNALKYLGEYFHDCADFSSPYDDDPMDIHVLSFSPNGDVLNGNVYKTDILTILTNYRPGLISR
ncbi:MAG: radical SAM protein [Clostridia bacterium]|nr:radical SAM protein [Clostridia bacterium]